MSISEGEHLTCVCVCDCVDRSLAFCARPANSCLEITPSTQNGLVGSSTHVDETLRELHPVLSYFPSSVFSGSGHDRLPRQSRGV